MRLKQNKKKIELLKLSNVLKRAAKKSNLNWTISLKKRKCLEEKMFFVLHYALSAFRHAHFLENSKINEPSRSKLF